MPPRLTPAVMRWFLLLTGCGGVPTDAGDAGASAAAVVYADPGATFAAASGVGGGDGGLVVTTPGGDATGARLTLVGPPLEGMVAPCVAGDARFAEGVWPDATWLAAGELDPLGRAYGAVYQGGSVWLVAGPLTGWVGPSAALGRVAVGDDAGAGGGGDTPVGAAILPDATGDGTGDLLVLDGAGAAWLLEGPLDGDHDPAGEAYAWWSGPVGTASAFGGPGAGLPGSDLDGDGYADALVQAPDHTRAWALPGGAPGEGAPLFVVAVGDLGGDPATDTLAVAAAPTDDGVAVVLGLSRGGDAARSELLVLSAPTGGALDLDGPVGRVRGDPGDRLGAALAIVGADDGAVALWAAAPGCAADASGACTATAWRFDGLPTGDHGLTEAAASLAFAGPVPAAAGLLLAGDLDGDGVGDLAVETRRATPAAPAALAVYGPDVAAPTTSRP